MSKVISGALIDMLEKELKDKVPEVEAYVLKIVNELAAELMQYVEKKIAPAPINPPSAL